tara:strand:- start:813 stop:1070 length:258 start_codon:yes stop_codon:yes gene_type:complete
MITIMDAIRSLATGASYTIVDDQINWFSPDITQPTQAEIDAEIARLQAEYEAKQIQAEADKASAVSKLEALGLTDAEIKALSGGL